jgi:hypothetical protein
MQPSNFALRESRGLAVVAVLDQKASFVLPLAQTAQQTSLCPKHTLSLSQNLVEVLRPGLFLQILQLPLEFQSFKIIHKVEIAVGL